MGGAFRAGVVTYATSYAFSEIGSYFRGLSNANVNAVAWEGAQLNSFYNFGGNLLTGGQVAAQIAAHAVVGGISAELSGGKFGHGFFSAGVTKGLGGAFLPGGSDLSGGDIAKGTVVSMVIGGTASVISGGKFANGANTAAMQYLFNQVKGAWERNAAKRRMAKLKQGAHDGDLTLEEAQHHYKFGKGQALIVDLKSVDLSGISVADFNGATRKSFNLLNRKYFSSLNDGLVYGNITLTLDSNGYVSASYDTFNFEIHGGFFGGSVWRNIGTVFGNIAAGQGQDFDIYFRGKVKL